MAIKKEDVRKALASLEQAAPDLAKGGADLNSANGAAEEGGGDGKLKAPGEAMPKKYGVGKAKGLPAKKSMDAKADKDDGDEEEEATDDGDDEGGEEDAGDGPAKKSMPSFADDMPSEIQTKVDVSQFLRSLVDHTAQTVNGMRDVLVKSDLAQDGRIASLEEGIEGLSKSMGNIGVVLAAICERIGVVESAPAQPKSVVKSAAPVKRDFAGGEEAGKEEGGLYKSLVGKPAHIQPLIHNPTTDNSFLRDIL